ncbi:MAG: serine/threonine-protein kinase [Polyangiaceae bacterium]
MPHSADRVRKTRGGHIDRTPPVLATGEIGVNGLTLPQAHFVQSPSAGVMQSQPSESLDKHNGQSSPPASTALEVEAKLDGRYLLRRLLARGGGAQVLAAEHLYTHRAVAVKIPLQAGPLSVKRFEREIEVLSRVRGEGIVEMLDAGHADGAPYVVFELLEGRTLAGLLAARGRLGIPETLEVGRALSAALARCHARGVVHRDVKPSNLFLPRSGKPSLVVLDFGIAQLADDGTPAEKLTREDSLLGTPEYMAPEALLANATDHRVDVYAVGVTLYECLTGTVPFDGKYADVLLKLSTSQPRSLREQRSDVPEDLEQIVTRCLAREAKHRFQSMQDLANALDASALRSAGPVNLLARNPPRPEVGADKATLADAPKAMSTDSGASRRRHPRAPYITLARLTRQSGERVDGRLEEISEGGLQFVGDRAIPAGESVQIRFALPASGRITEAQATARWNRTLRGTNATGFEFSSIADNARAEIRKYATFVAADPNPT